MLYRGMMMFPVFALLLTVTACTAFRSIEGSSPEEMKKSELSKNDLWNLTTTLEKEKTACQMRLVDQEGVIDRINRHLSDQQSEMIQANQHISELNDVIEDLRAKLKQIRETCKKESPSGPVNAASSASWGTIVHVEGKTNIRTKRSLDSRIRGSLMPGQPVKADFLKDNWYAVFKITEAVRSENKALGYVYAPRLLKAPSPERVVEKGETEGPSAADKSAQETFSVAVKSIRHKVLQEGKEVLLVEFDRFYVPAVYNIEGNAPMIIMDVTRTSSMKKEWSTIRTKGTLIKKIRVNLNRTTDILRIVLDMTPDKDYDIKPTFYMGKDSKVYAVEVTGITLTK
jgi:uncharacterized coiled-coil protein SlyX